MQTAAVPKPSKVWSEAEKETHICCGPFTVRSPCALAFTVQHACLDQHNTARATQLRHGHSKETNTCQSFLPLTLSVRFSARWLPLWDCAAICPVGRFHVSNMHWAQPELLVSSLPSLLRQKERASFCAEPPRVESNTMASSAAQDASLSEGRNVAHSPGACQPS